jgi:uncharacterized membrane protein
MRTKNKRILTWVLVGLAAAILILGTVLFLNLPAGSLGANGAWMGHAHGWLQGQAGQAAQVAPNLPGVPGVPGDGAATPVPPQGFAGRHHPGGMFGGLLLVLGLVALLGFLLRRRGHYWRHAHHGPADAGQGYQSAEEILRQSFASGTLSAEEYQSRLNVLRGKGV